MNKLISKKRTLEEMLVKNCGAERKALKKILLKNNVLENKCAICGQLPIWDEKPLVMVLDHINGINNDNRLENLRFLCPNCNSQTDTFAGRNSRKLEFKVNNKCISCGKGISSKATKCVKCGCRVLKPYRKCKVSRPSKAELENLLWAKPTTHIAKQYGVSDKAVDKWAKSYNLQKPPRGYWTRFNRNKDNLTELSI